SGFNFGTFYQALERHRADTIALTGMRLGGIPWGGEAPADGGHGSGGWACLTARSSQNTGSGTGPSIDQFIARKLFEQGQAPNANAPVFRVGPGSGAWQSYYEAAGTPVPHLVSPMAAFTRMFANVSGTTNTAQTAALLRKRRSILDTAWGDCRSGLTSLPAAGRAQLDYHCSRIRELEQTLMAPPVMTVCAPPQAEAMAVSSLDVNDPNNYPALTTYFFKLMETAFVCDVTRVASLSFGTPAARFNMPWLNLPTRDFGDGISGSDHHTYSHGALPDELARFVGWYATQVSAFLDRLKAPQPDGSRLLDDTLVYWTGEIGNTWPSGASGALHDVGDHTMFVFGSMRGAFRSGRHLRFSTTNWIGGQSAQARLEAVNHHQLLVSLIQAMGVTGVNQFGDPNGGSGPLARMA
ncbi:MAG: DUF1552 domain-containing protein, partial [Archangium sp.]|nr:DUF1552 domain-containing protein [Archangium sp.]